MTAQKMKGHHQVIKEYKEKYNSTGNKIELQVNTIKELTARLTRRGNSNQSILLIINELLLMIAIIRYRINRYEMYSDELNDEEVPFLFNNEKIINSYINNTRKILEDLREEIERKIEFYNKKQKQ